MKKPLSLVALGAMLIGTTWAAQATKARRSSYTDETYGFALEAPRFPGAGPNQAGMPLVVSGPPEGGFASNVNVGIQATRTTRQGYRDLSLGQFRQLGFKVNSARDVTVSGREAIRLDYEGQLQRRDLHFLSLAIVDKDRVVLVTCTTTPAAFPAVETRVQRLPRQLQAPVGPGPTDRAGPGQHPRDSWRMQRMEPYTTTPAGAGGVSAVAAIEPDLTGRDLPWVRLGPGRRYFETEAGEPFLIIGQNDALTWPELEGLLGRRDVPAVDRHLGWLRAHGVTTLRVMLEYVGDGLYLEHRPGEFDPVTVQAVDDLVALCERHGLRLLLTPFDTFFTWVMWDDHPYNAGRGGPCRRRLDLLTDPDGMAAVKRRVEFAVGRWGARAPCSRGTCGTSWATTTASRPRRSTRRRPAL